MSLTRASTQWRNYLHIARPDHWIKNVFMLPGSVIACMFTGSLHPSTLLAVAVAMVALCLAASANYTINESLDSAFDRFHPVKKLRPGALGLLDPRLVALQYAVLVAASLAIAVTLGQAFVLATLFLLLMGVLYNVPPIRTKDCAYLDVLSESINNPLRLLMGWLVVIPDALPPSSLLLSYWMGGAFLMAMKRFCEYRSIGNPKVAAAYRRSFRTYTEDTLLLSSVFYAVATSFLLGVFLIKYRIEYLLAMPGFALLFTWYLAIALQREGAAQAPEKLHRETRFMAFVAALVLALALLSVIDIPALDIMARPLRY
jgi:4-hydroxybenzoate polyprenyltransferase